MLTNMSMKGNQRETRGDIFWERLRCIWSIWFAWLLTEPPPCLLSFIKLDVSFFIYMQTKMRNK